MSENTQCSAVNDRKSGGKHNKCSHRKPQPCSHLLYSVVDEKPSRSCDPPTSAESHVPFLIYLNAKSKAYAELLQAVSTVNDGPRKPKAKLIRFER